MHMIDQLGHLAIGGNEAVGKLYGMRGSEADALDALDIGDISDKQREIGHVAVAHHALIGIYVLAEQRYLAHALTRQLRNLIEHIVERTAHLFATRIRHYAERAVFATALHDGDESCRASGAWRGQVIEFFDLGKGDVDHRCTATQRAG